MWVEKAKAQGLSSAVAQVCHEGVGLEVELPGLELAFIQKNASFRVSGLIDYTSILALNALLHIVETHTQ